MVMQKTPARAGNRKPAIQLSEADYDLIATHAMNLEQRAPELARMLLAEVDRAKICAAEDLSADVIALGSTVSYSDSSSGTVRTIRLVAPQEADIEKGQVSILTPVAVGLIGLRPGQSIDWPCPDGRPRILTVLSVARSG